MARLSRRRFLLGAGALVACGAGGAAALAGDRWLQWSPQAAATRAPVAPPTPWSIEARYYASFAGEGALDCAVCHGTTEDPLPVSFCHTPHAGDYVQCELCPHRCILRDGERGTCRVRENRGGRLYSLVFGNPCAVHVDPIEKKPFYHFLPGAAALSIATAGCNLRCLYCQNWPISQATPEELQNADLPPEAIVRQAQQSGATVIAYTYTEPTVFYEYMLATSRLARPAGLRNAVVSAGFINPEPLRELCAAVDAIKIDLKGYDEGFYQDVCQGHLQPVLTAIRTIHEAGVHLEIVNLVVPTLNDSLEQLRALARWVAHDLSPDIPLHFSRFQPLYRLAHLPMTPVETLDQARDIALEEGLRYVYVGNVLDHPGNHTYCPVCGRTVIVRQGFAVMEYHVHGGLCAYCGAPIAGVWWPGDLEPQPAYGSSGAADY